MDTQKLLRVLTDILNEHSEKNIGGLLSELESQLAQNTPEGFDQANATRSQLVEALASSYANNYAPSYWSILSELGADRFVGSKARDEIDKLFDSGQLRLQTGLSSYSQQYREFLERATALKSSLEKMEFQPYRTKNYEVGFVVPNKLKNLQTIAGKLGMWDRFLVICSAIAGDHDDTTLLTRTSTGTLEFFVEKGIEVAKILDVVLAHVVGLYLMVQQIQKNRLELDELKIRKEIREKINAGLSEAEAAGEEEALEDATKEVFSSHYKGLPDRKHELESQFKVGLKVVLNDIQEGIDVEISAPILASDEKENSKTQKTSESIGLQNAKLKQLYDKPVETRKLPVGIKVTESELKELRKAHVKTQTEKDAEKKEPPAAK